MLMVLAETGGSPYGRGCGWDLFGRSLKGKGFVVSLGPDRADTFQKVFAVI